MSLYSEYIRKIKDANGIIELENELNNLIDQYNKTRKTYLFVYATAMDKGIPQAQMLQEDYYIICDFLRDKKRTKKLDFYIETPGGSGKTAEDTVKFLRSNFNTVSFVISGEAKSAGTIMVMSGDKILMTQTGSLGPIDAQLVIGRSRISAYDYI